MIRKTKLENNQVYHIINRSIAGFNIFNNDADYSRFYEVLAFSLKQIPYRYSLFHKLSINNQQEILNNYRIIQEDKMIEIIAYCIMPTHIHLILKQLKEGGISNFVGKVLNSYTKYFNTKYKRKGPLWENRFKNILVPSDEILLHLTRYVHLNPCSAGLVSKPEQWNFSSYNEYLNKTKTKLCAYDNLLDIDPIRYKKFVDDRIDYQKEISLIKNLLLENYSG